MISPISLVRAIPTPWAIAGGLALGAALIGYGYVKGLRSEADRHAATIAQIATLGARQSAATAATARQQADITRETETDHAQRVDLLRHRLGPGRVRQPATVADRGAVPRIPSPAGQPDGTTADAGLGAGIAAPACAALESDAALTTLQVLEWQAWATRQRTAWETWCASVDCAGSP